MGYRYSVPDIMQTTGDGTRIERPGGGVPISKPLHRSVVLMQPAEKCEDRATSIVNRTWTARVGATAGTQALTRPHIRVVT